MSEILSVLPTAVKSEKKLVSMALTVLMVAVIPPKSKITTVGTRISAINIIQPCTKSVRLTAIKPPKSV